MVGTIVTLEADYTTRFGTQWPSGTELELEGKLRKGWQIGFKTPEVRISVQGGPAKARSSVGQA
jgi:hypothetical protein